MRMRKKKHLEERLEACASVMLKMQNQNEHANDPLDDELFFDSMKVFGNNNPLHLEVGCGKGSFILELAQLQFQLTGRNTFYIRITVILLDERNQTG